MAEKQQDNRIFLEQTVIKSDTKRSAQGLWAGTFVASLGYLTAGFLAFHGHDTVAGIIAIGITSGLVGVFITGRVMQGKERKDKAELMEELLRKRVPSKNTGSGEDGENGEQKSGICRPGLLFPRQIHQHDGSLRSSF